MAHIYKIKLHGLLRQFMFCIGVIVFSLIGEFIIINFRGDQIDFSIVTLMTVSVVLIFFIPSFLLHFQYFLINRNKELIIDEDSSEIMFRNRNTNKLIVFTEGDIREIIDSKTKEKKNKQSSFFPWYNYSYATIILKNGIEICITSLLVNNIESVFDQKHITVSTSFYNWISRR
ncbi:MAG: hypothetical protein RH860_01690 [Cytophagales bacterium]